MGSSSMEEMVKIPSEEEEGFLRAIGLPSGIAVMMVSKAAIELGVFEIIAKGGEGAKISAKEIADCLPTQNPNAPVMLDRMLKFLANQSILRCTLTEDNHCSYSLTPISKNFVPNEDGVSLSALVQLITDKVFVNSWYALKDAVLEGGVPFNRTHGMHAFEYPGKDRRFNEVFNRAMHEHSAMAMKRVVECYKGFEGVKEVVDVGGGFGSTLSCIISKYPNIKGINYDLPHVIKEAPAIPGVEHIPGDMFESVPCGEIIFMKWILHDWDDEHCLKLLKNCWKALPESGKVVLVEGILPEHPEKDVAYGSAFYADILMMTMNPGGKERTQRQFEALAKEAGFAALKAVCAVNTEWVIELYK
ncbi:PREDICTED: caffeic acid 3-O-methyltransferase-like [Ipomoea nil]|uniref:caffeic acid 3-O-methyltransferase-like n=1 Tax=Ipomoea nil TaxID=35883 RepID=UPI000901FA88|nr:PREDICTED: caffeic acid 3-O-methyltransferase-like [Ipomoea nil]